MKECVSKMKKFLSIMLALVLCFSMVSVAFAGSSPTSSPSGGGSIQSSITAVDANGKTSSIAEKALASSNEVYKAVKAAGSADKFLESVGLVVTNASGLKVHSMIDVYVKSGSSTFPVTVQIPVAGVKTTDAVVLVHKTASGYELINAKVTKNGLIEAVFNSLSPVVVLVGTPKDNTYNSCSKDADCVLAQYSDLVLSTWYHDGIHYCVENGLMKGVGNGKFNPTGNTSRAMMMTIVARMGGAKCDSVGANWYVDGVNYVIANKISDGSRPTEMITREEFAVMLYNFAKTQGKGFKGDWVFPLDFKDASKVSDDALEGMTWCVMNKIVNGRGGIYAGMLDPKGLLTRAEASAMIQRYYEVK